MRLLATRRRRVLAALSRSPRRRLVAVRCRPRSRSPATAATGDEQAQAAPPRRRHSTAHDAHPGRRELRAGRHRARRLRRRRPACHEQAYGNIAYEEGPQAALAAVEEALRHGCRRRGRLPPDRPHDRLGRARPLRGRHRRGVRRTGRRRCCVRLLPRHPRARVRGRGLRDDAAQTSRRLCDDENIKGDRVPPLPVRPRARPRPDDLLGLRPALGARDLRRPRTDWDQPSCTGGVFMENISTSLRHQVAWVRGRRPDLPVRDVEERHKLYCYLHGHVQDQRAERVRLARRPRRHAARVERGWVTTCFESYGRDASGFSARTRRDLRALPS